MAWVRGVLTGFGDIYAYICTKGGQSKCKAKVKPCWAMLGPSWDHFGTSLAVLSDFEALLEQFWSNLGPFGALFGAFLGQLGAILCYLRPSWAILGASWEQELLRESRPAGTVLGPRHLDPFFLGPFWDRAESTVE